jgi:hypothetical protein
MFSRLPVAVLFYCVGIVCSIGARSSETASALERSVDLTTEFLQLSFSGVLTSGESGGDCVYRIPTLKIRFAKGDYLAKAIQLDQFRIIVVAPEGQNRALLERRYPLLASLSVSQNEVQAPTINFAIPKTLMRQAEYLGIAVAGRPVFHDEDLAKLPPSDRANLERGRALWPIAAKANVASQTRSGDGERFTTVYRVPRDPNDDCSSVKVR